MLDGSPANGDEANIGNVENNNPIPSCQTKQALLKKGGRKPVLHHQKPPRHHPNIRLSDNNNNNSLTASSVHRAAVQSAALLPAGNQTVLNLHHVKQGAKKEVLKSKVVQPPRHLPRHDQITHNVNTRSHKPKQSQSPAASPSAKKNDNRTPKKPSSSLLSPPQEQKKPLNASDNTKIPNSPCAEAEYLKDCEKIYAGAKFSEPPSPSVLPKPPSHWVGDHEPQKSNQSREQMTVHLKSLLKVQDVATM
ncbi:proline-rich nuclear receptor coactivator 1 [Girardinichthys multiradiatus]|uniref:proline-rich nuclear receptor coactivator 1 n=1 Tax=Girardinichthys multiradiatus TaxID=208333 RepID=UPI001FAD0139|nr:proline-rich nuclear receptor coactivator 1 [Girardinichthys multiradiatus]